MGRTPEEELLRANAAFYQAFAERDIEAMDELWAHRLPVVCVHPGWAPLHGREDVISSWRAILLGGNSPPVQCEGARALLLGETGIVTCREAIQGDALVATNLFALEDGIWQLVSHQAGPLTRVPESSPPGQPLN